MTLKSFQFRYFGTLKTCDRCKAPPCMGAVHKITFLADMSVKALAPLPLPLDISGQNDKKCIFFTSCMYTNYKFCIFFPSFLKHFSPCTKTYGHEFCPPPFSGHVRKECYFFWTASLW